MKAWWIFLVLLSACASLKVETSYNSKHNFKNDRSWCWLNGCQPSYEGPRGLVDSAHMNMVANEIAYQMQEKGFIKIDDTSDLLLDFHIILAPDSTKTGWVQEEDLQYLDPYKKEDYYHFLRGSLVIDITERASEQIVWQSTSKQVISLREDITKKEMRKVIKKAMKDFPPN
ncbi:DUF4136 domain-containing protein [Fulvivirga sediminis]|uniref:DUF4136 domain-containing protein n=1 Tax=Fulvivirga sediminis TaxID=2803949 RepID=A0A937FCH5_9BACT|nr:DUF4136 domain-containing protein [Fulvivirga sediminis]MBL3658264.1 DUF4136 domain-containing protein [Fulvivirga sediminis]